MRTNKLKPPVVMEWGHSQSLRDVSWGEFDDPHALLPEAIEVLLCLLDGAERRHRLMMRWSARSAVACGRKGWVGWRWVS
jgi:hypothetical protein